jgi:hypothetical protein
MKVIIHLNELELRGLLFKSHTRGRFFFFFVVVLGENYACRPCSYDQHHLLYLHTSSIK